MLTAFKCFLPQTGSLLLWVNHWPHWEPFLLGQYSMKTLKYFVHQRGDGDGNLRDEHLKTNKPPQLKQQRVTSWSKIINQWVSSWDRQILTLWVGSSGRNVNPKRQYLKTKHFSPKSYILFLNMRTYLAFWMNWPFNLHTDTCSVFFHQQTNFKIPVFFPRAAFYILLFILLYVLHTTLTGQIPP